MSSTNGALTSADLLDLYRGLDFNITKASENTKHPTGKWANRRHRSPTDSQWDALSRHADKGKPLFLMTGSASDVVVLDIDSEEGIALWKERLGDLWDEIPRVHTTRGYHLYFATYDNQVLRSIRRLDDGWELKAENTGVVLPSGDHNRVWEVMPSEELPDIRMIEQWLPAHDAEEWDQLDVPAIFEGVPIGERDDAAYRYASSLRSRSIKRPEAIQLMTAAWEHMEQDEQNLFPLKTALEKVERVYRTKKAGNSKRYQDDKPCRIDFDPASSIRSERVHWLWEHRMAQRSLTVVAGEKGKGKSILTNAWLPAKVTRGTLQGELDGQPADVLIVSAEDDWRSMIKPRLTAAGANLDRAHRVTVRNEDGEVFFTLPDHVAILEAEVLRRREEGQIIALLVIDPLGAFLSSATDSYKDASVRRALAPLAEMAAKLDLAVLVVMHLTKDQTKSVVQRVGGSGAFANAARSVFALVDDPDDERRRVLVHAACNWGLEEPSLNVRIVPTTVALDDGTADDYGRLVFVGESMISADDVQRGESTNDCDEAILAQLEGGPQWSIDVKKQVATLLKCSNPTVERAAQRLAAESVLVVEKLGRRTKWRRYDDDVNDVNDVCDVNDVSDVVSHNSHQHRITSRTSRANRRDVNRATEPIPTASGES